MAASLQKYFCSLSSACVKSSSDWQRAEEMRVLGCNCVTFKNPSVLSLQPGCLVFPALCFGDLFITVGELTWTRPA